MRGDLTGQICELDAIDATEIDLVPVLREAVFAMLLDAESKLECFSHAVKYQICQLLVTQALFGTSVAVSRAVTQCWFASENME